MNFLQQTFTTLGTKALTSLSAISNSNFLTRCMATLDTMHRQNLKRLETPFKRKKSPLDGKPYAKGIVLKTLIKKPRKPNSANRKCVLVKLSIGKEMIAFVPGIGHNLQEHQTVLCRVGRLRDTPGVKIRCIRGKYDLPHVQKK